MKHKSLRGIRSLKRHRVVCFCLLVTVVLFPALSRAGTGADEGDVRVTAKGHAPVSQGMIQAKQVALLLAQRQAVEEASGMSMQVENNPDTRAIIEKAMAGLTYTIVSEQISHGIYTVEIQAVVHIPEKAAEQITNTSAPLITQTTVGAFIEKTPYGEINWTDGYIIAYGKGAIPKGLNQDICDSMAKRAAILDAHARALEMAQNINLDGDSTVKGFVSKDSRLFYRLKGLIARVVPFDQYKNGDFYNVKIKVPFYGMRGMQVVFLNAYIKSNSKSVKALPTNNRIVIDARGTGLKPALFVRIKDQTGNNVYTVKDVDRSSLQHRGMIQYVTSTTIQPDDVQAKAVNAYGRQNGNIVISSSDADKLKQKGSDSALSSGNVVVITDSPVGGTEGSLPLWFAEIR